jgi:UDP:flavonoid glycosyltransferase YjiC (YdhE family)
MKIAIIAPGSRGDIQPYVALGKGLLAKSHFVRIITNMNYESLVTAHGLDFWPIELDMQDYIQSEKMRAALEDGGLFSSMAELSKGMKSSAILFAERSLAACRDMDLIMGGLSGVFIGSAISEKICIPFLQAYNLPITPTRAFPGLLTSRLTGRWNRLSHQITRQIIWQATRPTDKVARKEVFDLPPAPFFGPFNDETLNQLPILYGYSPTVIPPPADWNLKKIYVTGYWTLPPEDGWRPPQDLIQFLECEPRPIYIGFGSMSNRDPQATADLVFDALEQTGQRAVVFSGWGGMEQSDLPESVLMIDSLPHSWLFPRVRVVVHHGGAGTTAAGLRAGVPSIIVPYHGDQPFWGDWIASLGVGPQPIPRKKLTAEKLAAAIKKAVSDKAMRKKAADLGDNIRAENGVERAIEVIEHLQLI